MPNDGHPAHAKPIQRGAGPAGLGGDVVPGGGAWPPVLEQVDADDAVGAASASTTGSHKAIGVAAFWISSRAGAPGLPFCTT